MRGGDGNTIECSRGGGAVGCWLLSVGGFWTNECKVTKSWRTSVTISIFLSSSSTSVTLSSSTAAVIMATALLPVCRASGFLWFAKQ